jgi:AAA+ ATPase superfamily predicted ATPase
LNQLDAFKSYLIELVLRKRLQDSFFLQFSESIEGLKHLSRVESFFWLQRFTQVAENREDDLRVLLSHLYKDKLEEVQA